METTQLTADIWMFRFTAGQAYALRLPEGWALIDTGLPGHAPEILAALAELGAAPADLRHIFLTHYHFDHTGSAAELAAATGAEILAGAADAPVIRGEAPEVPIAFAGDWERELFATVQAQLTEVPAPTPCRVDRELTDGDLLDWGLPALAVHVPGHTPGSMALHLPDSGVLFTGDTIANHPQVMLGVFNTDRDQAVASFHKQARLDVSTALFGHGEPLVGGAGEKLRAAAAELR
ncbi:MBL fold metallo-hydrolase [Streptomyces orinoci]|uniref:MBL fold metallo-hydrolase n=1 Tax=Streptomyces orinoci TaxID=67339 RepID=A0ABV3JX74_STRON|nr:MBL fold metallo-hydrolase [Streptomyces orinoci]